MTDRRVTTLGANVGIATTPNRQVSADGATVDLVPGPIDRRVSAMGVMVDLLDPHQRLVASMGVMVDLVTLSPGGKLLLLGVGS